MHACLRELLSFTTLCIKRPFGLLEGVVTCAVRLYVMWRSKCACECESERVCVCGRYQLWSA